MQGQNGDSAEGCLTLDCLLVCFYGFSSVILKVLQQQLKLISACKSDCFESRRPLLAPNDASELSTNMISVPRIQLALRTN